MKILLACIHYPVASGRYIERAFKRLGHDVKTVGPSTGNQIWGMTVKDEWIWKPDYPINDNVLSDTDWKDFDSWKPDLCITAESAWPFRKLDTINVIFGVDNHCREYYPELKYDALFLSHSFGYRMGEPDVYHLPCGYDPDMHKDLGLPRFWDVGMVGVPYQSRVEIATMMYDAGIVIRSQTGLLWEEYTEAYNRCKISLVKSACGDLAQRFFETMSMGCCVLADRTVDAENLGFVAGVDYWPYETPEEAVREAKYLLDTGKWEEIAENGKRKLEAGGHTWDARCQTLLDTLYLKGILKGDK